MKFGGMPRGRGPQALLPPRSNFPNNPVSSNYDTNIPFDLTFFQEVFPKFHTEIDDSELTKALLKRNNELTPSTEELQAIQNIVTKVQGIIENLILDPGRFTACQIDEFRLVGSFKQGVILAGHKIADFVIILKTLPTKEAVEALHLRIAQELSQTECIRSSLNPRGFELSTILGTVKVMVSTILPNLRKLDPNLHLDSKLMSEHFQAIKHSRWFEENAHNSTIKVLVRILRDIRSRFEGFHPLLPHMLDILAHFCVVNTPTREPLTLNLAFRRALSLMSSGMFLPNYAGTTSIRSVGLSYEEMDKITGSAQTLLLIFHLGGIGSILGLDKTRGNILAAPTVWDGVIVSPHVVVYQKEVEQEADKDIAEGEETTS